MEGLDLKQMTAMVDIIAEEKGLPKEAVLDAIQMAIAAAWRRDHGEKDMNVRAVLNTKDGTAKAYVSREVVEDDVAYIPATEIPLTWETTPFMTVPILSSNSARTASRSASRRR